RLVLAKVFDETEQPQKAEAQRKLVLEAVSDDERHAALEQHS
ncbi:TPA: heme biosynthesis protein HemY, partial [Neisseria meningitidis]